MVKNKRLFFLVAMCALALSQVAFALGKGPAFAEKNAEWNSNLTVWGDPAEVIYRNLAGIIETKKSAELFEKMGKNVRCLREIRGGYDSFTCNMALDPEGSALLVK